MRYMGLKNCMGNKTHRYYKHTKFRQNPRGDPKFLVDLTWNDPHSVDRVLIADLKKYIVCRVQNSYFGMHGA